MPACSPALTIRLPVVRARSPVPALTAPPTVNPATLLSEKPPAPVLVEAARVPIRFWPLRLVPPVDCVARMPALITPPDCSVIAPATVKPRLPVPALTTPVMFSPMLSFSERLPLPVAKAPRFAIALVWPKVALPTDPPVRVPAVMMPLDCVIVPAEVKVTVFPLAVTSPPRVRPPAVVVSVRLPAELMVPAVANACALVMLSSPEPVLLHRPKVASKFASLRTAPPTELPVSVAAVMMPLDCVIDPTEFSVTVLPLAVISRPSVRPPDRLVPNVRLPAELIVPDVVNDRALVKLSNPEVALLNAPKVPTIFGPIRLAPPTELPVSVAAVISPPV